MTIRIEQESYRIPDSWNSLSGDQYAVLCSLIGTYRDPQAIRVSFLFDLLGLKVDPFNPSDKGCFLHHRGKLIFLDSETIAEMCQGLDFLFTQDSGHQVLNPDLCTNHFKRITAHRKKLIGPEDKLVNVRLGEFIHADSLYHQFVSTWDPSALNKFLACLWREKDPQITEDSPLYKGDLRIAFNPYTLESQGGTVSFLSEQVKMGCFLFYAGSRNYISKRFPNLFSSHSSSYSPDAYMSLCYDLCNSDVSKINLILDSYVYDVFMFLENSIKNKHKS